MQVNETLSEGLKREFKIVVPNSDLESAVDHKLKEIGQTASMKGFRPGKIPMSILKQKYRPSVLGEILEKTVQESAKKAIEDRSLRPAMQPSIEITDFAEDKDLEFKLGLELFPDFEIGDLATIKLERLKCDASNKAVDEAVIRVSEAEKRFEVVDKIRAAESGDAVLIDFNGEVDGVSNDGLKGQDFELELGSESFIPGFERQLVGVKAGEKRSIDVKFPDEYSHADVAGKNAKFEVHVKELRSKIESSVDDEMAKRHGFEDLNKMKEVVKGRLNSEFEQASHARIKRDLLDDFAERYSFEVPQGMVEQEFEQIWEQIKVEVEQSDDSFEEVVGSSEEDAEQEYRDIATRRVRLGLVLTEIGQKNNITVAQQDLLQAALAAASNLPNPEQVIEFYRANPKALERYQAPVYEDKVVAFITELADVREREVTQEELFAEPEESKGKPSKKDDSNNIRGQKKSAQSQSAKNTKKPSVKKSTPQKNNVKKKVSKTNPNKKSGVKSGSTKTKK
tara:strand:- start:5667 stop:7193 length:1527 start_codon:yes stop_codon:yes gene_type:complete